MELIEQLLLFVVSTVANTFSAYAGGGAGLLQLPALIFLGLPFAIALATHKIASVALGIGAGRIADPGIRQRVMAYEMNAAVFRYAQRRAVEEAEDGATPGPVTSIFKVYGSELAQDYYGLATELRGFRGFGAGGDGFSDLDLATTRQWLYDRASSIYSGSNEIQRNIIAKRVLGLPD